MSKELDNIIKEELMRDIQLEAEGKKLKVYPKIAGLNNIGRTYFVNQKEVKKMNEWAQVQMAQKYGSEIYGRSGQQQGQRSNGTASATGTSSGQGKSSLISCKVDTFLVIPDKGFVKEASEQGFSGLKSTFEELNDFVSSQNEEWMNAHKDSLNKILKLSQNFREGDGAKDKENVTTWNKICDEFKSDVWETDIQKMSDLKKIIDNMTSCWKSWEKLEGQSGDSAPETKGRNDNTWNPNLTFRIDVQTNFNEDWFKREFKSGLLNAAIRGIKNVAVTKADKSASIKDKKWSYDQMEPSEKRKLDSIQWKMTNKVARDYITFLLGWSRDKVKYSDIEVASELKQDTGFGESMADKALSNRGILNRLAQKIFSGGQSTNMISVVFQLADPNDGWSVVEKKAEETPIEEVPDDSTGSDGEGSGKVSESIDVFESVDFSPMELQLEDCGIRFNSKRHDLVLEACNGKDVSKLVDNCLIGNTYR